MPSNLKLFFLGIVFSFLSTLYPRAIPGVATFITSRIPFLSSSSKLDPTLSRTWQSVQRYQQTVPISKNYEHSPESRWDEEVEKQLRFGSKEGGREMEKELKRVRREVEKRTEYAGKENMIKHNLPVYYLEQDLDSSILASIGQEINSVLPLAVVVVFANPSDTSSRYLQLGTPRALGHSPSRAHQSLLTSFASHTPSPVSAISSSLLNLPSSHSRLFTSLSLDKAIKLTLIGVPTLSNTEQQGGGGGGGWTLEDLWDIGEVLHEFRHAHHDHHHVKNPKRTKQEQAEAEAEDAWEEDDGPFSAKRQKNKGKGERDLLELAKRTVVVTIGRAFPKNVHPSFANSISEILEHSTSHARSLSLCALYSSTSGHKPTRSVTEVGTIGLIVATEAAGEGEGEKLDKEGKAWRFGGLPIQ